jgi:peptidoglycan/xylan/chitin deacetylase (PgdA/CDA1 family)
MAKKDIYYAALAPYRALFRTGLPLLCYHKVAGKPAGAQLRSTFISPGLFARQMRELRADGFRSAGPGACLHSAASSRAKEVVLTFDDGSLTALRAAAPVMAECGFTAINYLVADLPGGINEWDASRGEVPDRLMDDAEVREWMAAGHTIGAHTRTHPDLTKIPPDRAREEISGSKKSLEDRFGVAVQHFCYPYGKFSPAVRDLVAEAGYETAVTTEPEVFHPGTDPLLIPRFGARAHSLNFRNVLRSLTGQLNARSAPPHAC